MATKVKLIADGIVTADQLTLTTASTGTNTTAPATTAFVQQEVAALVDSSPDALNTLNELAAALGDDANFSTTVTNSIATKAPLASPTLTGTVTVDTDTNSKFTIADGGADAITLYGGSGDELYIGANAAYKLRFKTDGNIVMDNGGSFGIGTDNPGRKLHLKDGQIKFENTGSGNWAGLDFSTGNGTYDGYMGMLDSDGKFFIDVDSNGNDFVILQNGNVGIGQSGPYYKFNVYGANITYGDARTNGLFFDTSSATTGTGGGIALGGYTNGTSGDVYHFGNIQGIKENSTAGNSDSAMLFSTKANGAAPTEKMRIDSSGNLLVGQQTASSGTVGTSLRADGRTFFCADGNYAAHFNRNTSNGAIVHFAKDDNIVGSIGVVSDDRMYFATADGLGLQFDKDNNRIVPCDAAGAYNNNIELGESSLQFTNLWLSGTANAAGFSAGSGGALVGRVGRSLTSNSLANVNFYDSGAGTFPGHVHIVANSSQADDTYQSGEIRFWHYTGSAYSTIAAFNKHGGLAFGTDQAAANTLDDYEEGTYTATISCASGSISLNTSFDELRYIKIGNLVHVQGRLACNGVSSPTGATNLNLPFTSVNDTNKSGMADNVMTGYFNGSAVTNGIYTVYGNIDESSTNCRLFIMLIPATNNLGDNHMAGGSDLYINFTYQAA